jgi:hypothetical protein
MSTIVPMHCTGDPSAGSVPRISSSEVEALIANGLRATRDADRDASDRREGAV